MEERIEKTDEELVALSLENQEFFGYIMKRYTAPLSRYILRVVPSFRDSIDDVLQEVFIKIYLNLNNFDPSLKFSSWAYRITHNHAVSLFGKKDRGPGPSPPITMNTISLNAIGPTTNRTSPRSVMRKKKSPMSSENWIRNTGKS